MVRTPKLISPALMATCVMLAACSDADWENATSFLPMERGQKTTQETAQVDAPATVAPPPAAEPVRKAAPVPTAPATTALSPEPSQSVPVSADSRASTPASMPVAATSASEPIVNEHCRTVAMQRASDVQYMGMDEAAQHEEYERTYSDCAAWDAAHRY